MESHKIKYMQETEYATNNSQFAGTILLFRGKK